jgi:hypothetical protein
MPCDTSKLGEVFGSGAGAGAGAGAGVVAGTAISGVAGAASGVEGGISATAIFVANAADIGAITVAAPEVVIPVAAGVFAGALVGCGAADLSVQEGFCRGSAGTFSAQDWQAPASTAESRAAALAQMKETLNKGLALFQKLPKVDQVKQTQDTLDTLNNHLQKVTDKNQATQVQAAIKVVENFKNKLEKLPDSQASKMVKDIAQKAKNAADVLHKKAQENLEANKKLVKDMTSMFKAGQAA